MRNILLVFLLTLAMLSCSHSFSIEHAVVNWQNLDLKKDGSFGISTEKAYAELLHDKKGEATIVAVIDSGIDTLHEDLIGVLWADPIDGTHGRNYIAEETGKEDFNTNVGEQHNKIMADYNIHVQRLQYFVNQLKDSKSILEQIVKNIGKENPSPEDFASYKSRSEDEQRIIELLIDCFPFYPDFAKLKFNELDRMLDISQYHLEHGLSRDAIAHDTVKSIAMKSFDADISSDRQSIVPNARVPPAGHGTHSSGIIAAVRNNGKGINGIADHAQIMTLKCFSNIREMRNEYLAPAIRFAADHGARVINMSFGKTFSFNRQAVDSAVQYAMSKDVLIVHSAGNDGMDLDADSNSFFPSPVYQNGGIASAWITVGASGYRDDSTLLPSFSNYGHKSVDVFAPGVQVTSTMPHSKYIAWDGTSQAAPVVAGLAALIMSYYPKLSATQVKEIILKTVIKRELLKNKCASGGIVNAYNALKLAASYK